MEFYQLNYFLRVVEARSITRAAEELNLAQPALSQQIRKLEDELGTPLLIRGRRETIPTEAGRKLVEHSRLIREMVSQATLSIRNLVELRSGNLSIATIPTVSSRLLPQWIADFRQKYPEIDLVLREGPSDQVENWVLSGECEIGFTQLPAGNTGLKTVDLIRDRFVVLLPESHPLASKDTTVFSRLRGEPMILYRGGKLGDFVLSRCRASNWEPKIVCETNEFETLRALVQAGLGIAIVPEIAAPNSIRLPKMAAISLKDHRMQRRIGLIHRNSPDPSPAAAAFMQGLTP
jgi:DNA-binding transcriptional LysR family regulator